MPSTCCATPVEPCATRNVRRSASGLQVSEVATLPRDAAGDGCIARSRTGLVAVTRRIAAQTRQHLSGEVPAGATRGMSLHDEDARPIPKGRLGKPIEFGYKAQVMDNDDGIVLDHTVERGNPADAPQLVPAVTRVIARTGRRPRTVTADRGYGEARVENSPHELGVRTATIPRKGRPGQARQALEASPGVPPKHQMVHRQRGPDQHPQTTVRMGPNPPRSPRRGPDLGRTRGPDPQPRQDRRAERLIDLPQEINTHRRQHLAAPISAKTPYAGRSS
jgi:IS5 family transposase